MSRRKDKGATFVEYIKNAEDMVRKEKSLDEEKKLISGLSMDSNISNNNSSANFFKHNAPNSSSPRSIKKLKEYKIDIGVKFNKNKFKNWSEISSNLGIICQVYLPRGTEIKPVKDQKTGEIFAVINSRTHKEKYDISYVEQDIKRNIISVESVNLLDIQEIK